MLKRNPSAHVAVKYFLPAILIFLISGCSLWRNFTTYFNTYYNAKTLFEEVELEIFKTPKELFGFKEFKVSQKLNESLEKVIEKCSKIMQYETESAFFDDALYITGKAFYYQQNYSKALRKFVELSALDESDYFLENKLWIGKTRFQLREYDEAYDLLEEVKVEALDEDREDIFTDAYIKQISYLIFKDEYFDAITQAEKFAAVSRSDELKAEIFYELGKLYLKLDDLENAARVFNSVSDYSPKFDIEFSSKFEYAKIEKREGNIDESLELFEKLRNENKFADSLGIVELEIADIYLAKDDVERAYNHLTYIDTTFIQDPSGGIAKFRRAEIVERIFMDYDSAFVLYNGVLDTKAPKSIKDGAKEMFRIIDKYHLYHRNIHENKRLLSYIEDPSLFVRDSIAYEEYLEQRFIRADSIKNAEQTTRQMMANLGTTPTNTNQIGVSEDGTRPGEWMTVKNSGKDNEEIMYAPPKPTISADSVQKLNAKEYYDLGNLFFTDMDVPDSANYYYDKVLNEYPNNHHYARALYAKGTYYLAKKDKPTADSLFQIIFDNYPNEKVFTEAAKQLGKFKTANASDPAYPLFIEAEKKYYDSQVDSALAGYTLIYRKYSESPLAPKALLAIGFILENDFQNSDSAVVMYDTLIANYGDSQYARNVFQRVSTFKIEKAKIETEKAREAAKIEIEKAAALQAAKNVKTDPNVSAKKTAAAEEQIKQNTREIKTIQQADSSAPAVLLKDRVNQISSGVGTIPGIDTTHIKRDSTFIEE